MSVGGDFPSSETSRKRTAPSLWWWHSCRDDHETAQPPTKRQEMRVVETDPARSTPSYAGTCACFLACLHPRLGKRSPANVLGADCARRILEFALPKPISPSRAAQHMTCPCNCNYNGMLLLDTFANVHSSSDMARFLSEFCGADDQEHMVSYLLKAAVRRGASVELGKILPFASLAELNADQGRGWTLMHHAVMLDSPDVIVQLVEAGAHVNMLTPCSHTPLDVAAMYWRPDAILDALVKVGGVYRF